MLYLCIMLKKRGTHLWIKVDFFGRMTILISKAEIIRK